MDDIEAWGKRLLLACIKGAGDWYKALHIIENLSSQTNRYILVMRAFEWSYPRPLAGRLVYRFHLWGTTYPEKKSSGVSWDYGAIYQGSTRPSASVDTFCTASFTESGLSYNPKEVTPNQRNYCYIVSLVTRSRTGYFLLLFALI